MSTVLADYRSKHLLILGSAIFILSGMLALVFQQCTFLAIPFTLLALWASKNNVELLFFALLIFIPFSIELKVTKSLSTDFPDELLMWLLTAIVSLNFIFKPEEFEKIVLTKNPIYKFILLGFTWLILCTLFSSDIIISIKYVLSKFWYLCTFFFLPLALFSNPNQIKKIGAVLIASMLLIIVYSFIMQINLGFSFLRVNETVRPFFRNHVTYSALLACIIPVLLIYYFGNKRNKLNYLVITLIIICIANLIFSYSRGAWLGLFFCIPFYYILRYRLIKPFFKIGIGILLVSLFLVISTGGYKKLIPTKAETIYHTNFKNHLKATYQLTDMSFAERLHRWIAGIRMTKNKPIVGYGPNTFSKNYKAHTLWEFETWVSDNKERSSIHNYYLLQFAEQGIAGGTLFLLLLYWTFARLEYLYHQTQSIRRLILSIGCVLVVITIELFVNDLIETDKIGGIFYLCLASIIVLERWSNKKIQGLQN